ncbi:DddA-like double-stranded DNA deaminase toxin [Micromonospora sp. NPDC049366]|uniref:DddA-like double-stranded DNA deaminase toxin n=1 Tax=Micromonospora sp. NPDC049366 TaxID=3364271 RepID=UPI0037942FB6
MKHAVPQFHMPTPRAGRAAGGGPSGSGGQRRPGQSPPTSQPLQPVTPGWTQVPGQAAPQHVRTAAQDFQPRYSGEPRPTTASYNGQTITSGGGQRHLADDLAHERLRRDDGRPYPQAPNVLFEHPEMKVAADLREQLRRNGTVADAEVVVDNSMCGTRPFDQNYPLTCDKLLADTMPAGSRMTVWSTLDGGATFYQNVITGTGRLIRP